MEPKQFKGRKKPITDSILGNLFGCALQRSELSEPFPWHPHADSEKSSHAFCLSAFGSLRHEQFAQVRDAIVANLISEAFPWMSTRNIPRRWKIGVEVERPE